MSARLVIVCGNAGTGKTTYARELANRTRAALLDIDTVSETLVQVGLLGYGIDVNDRDSPRYKQLYRDAIHETLFKIAAENLDHTPIIIVAPFTQERRDAGWPRKLRERLGTDPRLICLHCAEDMRRQRIRARGNPRDAAKLEDWARYAAAGEDAERPPFAHEWVDTTGERHA